MVITPRPSSLGSVRVASRVRGAEPRGRAEGRPQGESGQVEEEREATAGNGRARARWGRLAADLRLAGASGAALPA